MFKNFMIANCKFYPHLNSEKLIKAIARLNSITLIISNQIAKEMFRSTNSELRINSSS
jgi:hypothetical protein